MTEKKVACPTCGKMVAWRTENSWRPFCSERCKMIDLGEWATGKFKIPMEENDGFDENLGE